MTHDRDTLKFFTFCPTQVYSPILNKLLATTCTQTVNLITYVGYQVLFLQKSKFRQLFKGSLLSRLKMF